MHDPTNGQRVARGRPRTSTLSRREQVREAKRAQRERERQAGLIEVRLKLPAGLAQRLSFASQEPTFEASLSAHLVDSVIAVADYPQLQFLCWSRRTPFITARDAWSLYDRNRRFVDPAGLAPAEAALLERLNRRFGEGRRDA